MVWAAALALTLTLVPAVGDAGPASAEEPASECPAPGGGNTALADVSGFSTSGHEVVVSGGGWGHGIGMSQWGAFGASRLGCAFDEILATYYPGAVVEPRSAADVGTVRVGLANVNNQTAGQATTAIVDADAGTGEIRWDVCEPGAECAPLEPRQQPGERWQVTSRVATSPALVVTRVSDGAEIWRGGTASASGSTRLRVMHSGHVVTVRVGGLARTFRWGFTQLEPHAAGDGRLYVTQHVTSGEGASGMDRYLWGIAEVPSGWPTEALKVQAVAARSYASKRIGLQSRHAQCRCDLYSTVTDQVYNGWAKESADAGITNVDGVTAPWKAAVNETSGLVAVYHDPGHALHDTIVDTFYSSSHGGKSDASRDVWNPDLDIPYLRSVDTSAWEDAVAGTHERTGNRYHRWSVGFTAEEIAERAGLAVLERIEVVRTTPGDRPTRVDPGRNLPNGLRITGYDADGAWQERTYSGEASRSLLGPVGTGRDAWGEEITGIRSARFAITRHDLGATPPPPPPDISAACPDGEFDREVFPDVPRTVSHATAIDCLAPGWWAVVHGQEDGRYNPAGTVSRAQMAAFIARTLVAAGHELPAEPDDERFTDIGGNTHERVINQLAEIGLVEGWEDGTYRPSRPVTRAQMAAFIARMLEHAELELPDSPEGGHFADVGGNAHERRINQLAELDLVRGTNREERLYSPNLTVTRAQMASFIARSLNALVTAELAERPS